MALRLKYAGVARPTGSPSSPTSGPAWTAPWAAATAALFALPTYTAMLALRDLLVARGAAPRGSSRVSPEDVPTSGTTSSAAAYDLDLPLWRELADARGLAGARRRRRHRARRARPRAPRPRGRRARPRRRSCSMRCASAPRASPVTTVAADARDFAIDRRFPLVIVPMQTLQLLGGADGRARFLARVREHLAAGRPARGRAGRRARRPSTRSTTSPRRRTCARSAAWSTPAGRSGSATSATAPPSIASARSSRATAPARPSDNVVELDRVEPEELEEEAAPFGLRARAAAPDPGQTLEYVGSTVVMLRG